LRYATKVLFIVKKTTIRTKKKKNNEIHRFAKDGKKKISGGKQLDG